MAETILIRIDRNVDEKSKEMAAKLGLAKKKFMEESAMFFVRNNLSPIGFSPSASFDLSQLVMKSTERLIAFLKQQEKESIIPIGMELLRTQAALQALMNLVIDVNVPQEDQEDVARRLEAFIQKSLENLPLHAYQSNQSEAGWE